MDGHREDRIRSHCKHFNLELCERKFRGGVVRAELTITDAHSKAFFELLRQEKENIEQGFGEPLSWYSQDDMQTRRIRVERDAEIQNRATWLELFKSLRIKLEGLNGVFRERVKALDAEDWQPEEPTELV